MKTKIIKSAIPIYIAAAAWLVVALIFPPYKIANLLIGAVIAAVAYFVGGKIFPGQTVQVEEKLDAGDAEINRMLADSRAALDNLKSVNASLPSEDLTKKLGRMEDAGMKILTAVAQKPERAGEVRKFMNYYLPTTAKLLDQYRTLHKTGSQGDNIVRAMKSVENSMDMIATAFEKQLDNLYRNEAMDMTSDVQVLETMMSTDGLANAKGPTLTAAKDIGAIAKDVGGSAAQAAPAPDEKEKSDIELHL